MEKSGELALLSESRQPLVSETLDGRSDLVQKPWARLANESKVSGTFKLLRKTAAWMVKRIADLETSEMMLAHTEGSATNTGKMNKHYAGRDWQKLADTLQTMRRELLAAGILKAGVKDGQPTENVPTAHAA